MPRIALKTEDVVEKSRERVPVHESRNRLTVRGLDRENFYYRFTDMSNIDKIDKMLAAGYMFVRKGGQTVGDSSLENIESPDSLIITPGGSGKKLVLMALPMEFYKQDMKAKDEKIKEIERAMQRDLTSKADPNAKINYGDFEIKSKMGFDPDK